MTIRTCINCDRTLQHHAKDMCITCYKSTFWKPTKSKCVKCNEIRYIHAKKMCILCYNRTIRYNPKIRNRNNCIICGFNMGIHIHHIDKDDTNNEISNLVPICANHHILLHSKSMGEKINKILLKKLENNSK